MDYTERNQRIKELGNAIVPQVALQIFKAIEQYEIIIGTIPNKKGNVSLKGSC